MPSKSKYPMKEAIRLAYEDGLITREDMLQKQMSASILTPIVAKLNHLIAHKKKIVKFVVNAKSRRVMQRYFEEFCQHLEENSGKACSTKKNKRFGGFKDDVAINKITEKKVIVTNLMMKIQGVVKELSNRIIEIIIQYFNRLTMPDTDIDETTQFVSDILNEVLISISNHIDEVIHIAVIEAAFKKTQNDDDNESYEVAESDEDEINENDFNYSNRMETDEEYSHTESLEEREQKNLEESNEMRKDYSAPSFNNEPNPLASLSYSTDSLDHVPKENENEKEKDVLDVEDQCSEDAKNPAAQLVNTSYNMELDHNSDEEDDEEEEVEIDSNPDSQIANTTLAIESDQALLQSGHLTRKETRSKDLNTSKSHRTFECNIFDAKLQFDVDRNVCEFGGDLKEIMKYSIREGYKNFNKTCSINYKSFRMRNNKTITAYAYCSEKSCTTFKFTGSVDGTINVYRNGEICHRKDDSDSPKKSKTPIIEAYIEPEYVYVNNVFKK